MQKLLQDLFERECRNYEFYLRRYNRVKEQYDALQEREDEIGQEEEIAYKVKEMATLLTSESFVKEKEKIGLPDNFDEFEKAFLKYEPKDTSGEIQFLSKQKKSLEGVLEILRGMLKNSQNSLFRYISMASEKNVKFSFSKDDKTAIKMFVLYYSDGFNFKHDRDVIKVERCKLNETFLNAYTAETKEQQEKAQSWFVENAKKYKDF